MQSIKDGDADNLLYGLHKGLKFLSQNIEKAQIPQEYWNCTDAKYNGTMAKVIDYMIGPVISPFVDVIDGKLGEIYPSGGVGTSELTAAAACGIWNGMVGTFSGAINAINTLVAAGSCKGREGIWEKIKEIKNFQSPGCLQTPQVNCETGLTAFLKEMGTTLAGQPCVMAEMGGQVAFGVGLAVFTGGASSAVSGGTVFNTFVKTLKFADRVSDMFDIGGRVFSLGLQMAGQTIKFSMRGGKAIFKRVDVSSLHTKANVNGTDGINYTAYSDQNLSTAGNRVDPLRDADGSVIKNDDGLAIGCLSSTSLGWNNYRQETPVYYASADNTPAPRFEQANYSYAANGKCNNGVEVFLRELDNLPWLSKLKEDLRLKGLIEGQPDYNKFVGDFQDEISKITDEAGVTSFLAKADPDIWRKFVNCDPWVRKNTNLYDKIRNESVEFQNKVAEFYRTTMKNNTPAGFDGGNKNYNGVWFNEYGFPNFEKNNQTLGKQFNFPNGKGNYTTDFADARDWLVKQTGIQEIKDLGNGSPLLVLINGEWKKITWHHHENGTTLQPVFSDIHQATSHSGGVKTVQLEISRIYQYE